MEYGEIYFWTTTIHNWCHLLKTHEFKQVILDSFQYMTDIGKIDIYAFVIMPNHLHTIWSMLEPNGKETPQGSFHKYTAHCFKEMLVEKNPALLAPFRVIDRKKRFEFWQRDPLAIPIYNRKTALQKLNYLHNNPVIEKWKLADEPCGYEYSSAKYYERNEKNYPFLKDLWDVF
ncbi:MAG: transposase [Chitinophagaceae bacterium]|nr:transposase [Chitinophagaceae bacterium]